VNKQKACWVSTQTRKGWRLKLSVGPYDYPVRGLLVEDKNDIEKIVTRLGTVFVHLEKDD
jgi:hypothetical protein